MLYMSLLDHLHREARRITPLAARLWLNQLRRDSASAPAWRHPLMQVLRHSQVSGEPLSVQTALNFEEALPYGRRTLLQIRRRKLCAWSSQIKALRTADRRSVGVRRRLKPAGDTYAAQAEKNGNHPRVQESFLHAQRPHLNCTRKRSNPADPSSTDRLLGEVEGEWRTMGLRVSSLRAADFSLLRGSLPMRAPGDD